MRALHRFGFAGAVYPVNPKYPEIDGLRCYGSVADIPAPVDLAVIAVPANAAPDAVRACGVAGIPFCLVLSAGFRETGTAGRALEDKLLAAAREAGTRIVGPNCQGLLNVSTRLYAGFGSIFQEPDLLEGSLSLVTQSGGFGFSVLLSLCQQSVGFRLGLSTGNEADITTPEAIEALIDDPGTRVICAYIESVEDGPRLMAAARRAAAAGKPLLVWKSGNSANGAKAATSHTGGMTGSYDIYRAAFRQCGIIEIHDIDDLADACRAFGCGLLPKGARVASVGISGGAGILFADRAAARGLTMSALGDETNTVLRSAIPSFGSIENPVDVTAAVFNDFAVLTGVINAILADPEVDQVAVLLASLPGEGALRTARAIREAIDKHGKPITLAWAPSRKRAEAARALLDEGHVPVFESPVRAAEAAAWLARFAMARNTSMLLAPPTLPTVTLPATRGALDEAQSKSLLREIGIATAHEVVRPADTQTPNVDHLSFPLAVKLLSRDVPHKSEVGGVVLGVTDLDGVAAAIRSIRTNLQRHKPEALIDGFLVAEMIADGLETLVGIVRDPAFGPVVAFGLGGVMTEVLKDVTYRVAPFGADVAREMITELRAAALFDAFRGRGALDVDALADALSRISMLAAREQRIAELDINPLFVRPRGQGVVAADALIVLR